MRSLLLTLSVLSTCCLALRTQIYFHHADKAKVPVVIWHGLGDRFDNPGLADLAKDMSDRFVHIIRLDDDGAADQRASFFGNAFTQIETVCEQLAAIPELDNGFHMVGFSQGGPLARAAIERCSLPVKTFVTLGSPHFGISMLPPCPPGSGPFSPCKLMQLGLVTRGMYSSWAQHNVVPAQYFRDPARIDEYLAAQSFLADINNERPDDDPKARNETYKDNMLRLERFVMYRFSDEATVVPAQSAHFRLPPKNATCTVPPVPPSCYDEPEPDADMPLYAQDYIGLRKLDRQGKIIRDVCNGRAFLDIAIPCYDD